MNNKVIGLVIAALGGGAIVWGLLKLTGGSPEPAREAPRGGAIPGEAPARRDAGPAGGGALPPGASGGPDRAVLPAPRVQFHPESAAARAVPGVSVDDELSLADAAFRSGDAEGGARRLRRIFRTAKESEQNLVPVVERLLEAEGDANSLREYLEYVQGRPGGDRVWERHLDRLGEKTQSDRPEEVRAAWRELSLAYESARDAARRRDVLGLLEPMLERLIFSGRFSPLVTSYTVRDGDSLSAIAARFGTTVDALRRLGGLASDVIQPRQRLRVLPGRIEIFVDKSDFRLWVTVGGNLLLERAVGLGKGGSTPTGRFEIEVRQKDPTWFRPGKPPLPPGAPGNILGSRWLGFRDTAEFTGYGIHGTDDPTSIGKESSAGCIRLENAEIELLYDFVPSGTPVTIRE